MMCFDKTGILSEINIISTLVVQSLFVFISHYLRDKVPYTLFHLFYTLSGFWNQE